MKKKQLQSSLLLLLTAMIWGTAFVAQTSGAGAVGTFTFNAARSIVGALFLPVVIIIKNVLLLPLIALRSRRERGTETGDKKLLWKGGILCGIVLCIASAFQQLGIQGTTVGKTGFITALYIVLVPVFGVFLHKKAGIRLWLSVLVAIFGLYLLCMNAEHFSINHYDVILLLCAASFAVQILCVDHFSPKVDPVKLSCIQFLVCSLLSFLMMVLTEHPSMAAVMTAWLFRCMPSAREAATSPAFMKIRISSTRL